MGERAEVAGVRAKAVALEDLRAGLGVGAVDAADQRRVVEQRLGGPQRRLQRETEALDLRAGGAVEHDRRHGGIMLSSVIRQNSGSPIVAELGHAPALVAVARALSVVGAGMGAALEVAHETDAVRHHQCSPARR
jgi:hypothetical protein